MTKVHMTLKLSVDVERVWKMIGGFNDLPAWHPMIATSELADGGRVRRMTNLKGGQIVERLEEFSLSKHMYSYSIVQGLLPVTNYKATIRISPQPGTAGSVVDWSSKFLPSGKTEEEAVAVVKSVYQAGFDNIKKLLNISLSDVDSTP